MSAKVKPMTPGVSSAARMRAYLAGAVVSIGLFGVAVKAWALQVDDGDKYRALAERQHAMRLDIPAPRGEILDAHGQPLAISADADSVWANPREVRDVASTAEKLAAILDDDPAVLESKLAANRGFVWLDRHVTPEVAKAIKAAKLPGIEIAREPRRWYPAKNVGGTVIGRADIDGNGLDGIEHSMNDVLTGKRGMIKALRDARGHRMLDSAFEAEAQPGATVTLTLDRTIQAISETALADAVTTNKAKSGVAVVIDVPTGRVLALASYPTYDPNSGHVNGARNKPVTDSFEAGSVMKVFSVAVALDNGIVKPDTEFAIGNSFRVNAKVKPITDVHSFPSLTVAGIIKHSSNIGAAKIALRLGAQRLYEGYKKFGFGAKTGIEMPGEQVGMLRKGETWRDVELATMSYGYGLTVTPLQIGAALASIGNHGIYHPPRIVDSVVDADGTVIYRGHGEERRVLSQKVADQMMPILAGVFDKGLDGGTAKNIDVPGFDCGGKTGTAYKYDPATHHYATDRYLASFAGLAPIDNPRLAIVVQIDEPSAGVHYGGDVSGPVFAAVASESLRYLGVPGSPIIPRDKEGKALVMLDPTGRPLHDAQGNYIALPQPPKRVKPAKPAPPPVVEEVAPAPVPDVPDFTGMGVSRALDEARKVHLDIEMEGSGVVVAQETIGPRRVKLTFSDDTRRISAH